MREASSIVVSSHPSFSLPHRNPCSKRSQKVFMVKSEHAINQQRSIICTELNKSSNHPPSAHGFPMCFFLYAGKGVGEDTDFTKRFEDPQSFAYAADSGHKGELKSAPANTLAWSRVERSTVHPSSEIHQVS